MYVHQGFINKINAIYSSLKIICLVLLPTHNFFLHSGKSSSMQLKQFTRWILLSILLILVTTVQAQQNKPTAIDKQATAILPKVIEWRRYLHQHPELSNR